MQITAGRVKRKNTHISICHFCFHPAHSKGHAYSTAAFIFMEVKTLHTLSVVQTGRTDGRSSCKKHHPHNANCTICRDRDRILHVTLGIACKHEYVLLASKTKQRTACNFTLYFVVYTHKMSCCVCSKPFLCHARDISLSTHSPHLEGSYYSVKETYLPPSRRRYSFMAYKQLCYQDNQQNH